MKNQLMRLRWNYERMLLAVLIVMLLLIVMTPGRREPAPEPEPEPDASLTATYQEVRDEQLALCGALCDFSSIKWEPVWDFSAEALQRKYRSVPVSCDALFSPKAEAVFEGPAIEPTPPRAMPLRDDFTLGGRVALQQMYLQNLYVEGTGHADTWSKDWTKERITYQVERLRARLMHGTYGRKVTNFFADILMMPELQVSGKRVLVVGSEKPWVEIALLLAGAAEVTTLDYGRIKTDHPQLRTITPPELNQQYRAGTMRPFDIAVSFSSIEHSGLGRYGDRLNPWGDLITVAKIGCLVKANGTMVIGVPSNTNDLLYNNAHRTYGLLRWPLLLTNWYPEKAWREKEGAWMNGIVWATNCRP